MLEILEFYNSLSRNAQEQIKHGAYDNSKRFSDVEKICLKIFSHRKRDISFADGNVGCQIGNYVPPNSKMQIFLRALDRYGEDEIFNALVKILPYLKNKPINLDRIRFFGPVSGKNKKKFAEDYYGNIRVEDYINLKSQGKSGLSVYERPGGERAGAGNFSPMKMGKTVAVRLPEGLMKKLEEKTGGKIEAKKHIMKTLKNDDPGLFEQIKDG